MLLTNAGEKYLLEMLSEVFLVIDYPHEALLDDVGHNHFVFVRLSTLIVWILWKCYMQG